MFSVFSKPPEPFKPILTPFPPRKPCSSTCNNQEQSTFLGQLPAEVRNEIYRYVFDSGPRELLSVEGHPLSLLLTCHKINHEASVLAFSKHAFHVAEHMKFTEYIVMLNAKTHLSTSQVDALTTLSYTLRRSYTNHEYNCAPPRIITNALTLFPNFSRFQLRILRGYVKFQDMHCHRYVPDYVTTQIAIENAPYKFSPHWFYDCILLPVANNLAGYAWQHGARWAITWPQMQSPHFEIQDGPMYKDVPTFRAIMEADAVGNVRGVHMCPCTCGNLQWTSADLVQQTGRRLAVDTVYYGPEDRPVPEMQEEDIFLARMGPNAVILKEGAEKLRVRELRHGANETISGIEYSADEEWWEARRRRRGDLGAVLKGIWRKAIFGDEVDLLPGSLAMGKGDWARMEEAKRKSDERAVSDVETVAENIVEKRSIKEDIIREKIVEEEGIQAESVGVERVVEEGEEAWLYL